MTTKQHISTLTAKALTTAKAVITAAATLTPAQQRTLLIQELNSFISGLGLSPDQQAEIQGVADSIAGSIISWMQAEEQIVSVKCKGWSCFGRSV